jgi:hypothetical protein
VIDPAEQIPAYIHIDHIDVTTTPNTHGSNSSNVTDAWVYVNDNLIGAFELPATIPVLASGNNNIKVYAGIKTGGISSLRQRYPFYAPYEVNLDLVPGEVDTLHGAMQPIVHYWSTGIHQPIWIEDYEDPGIDFSSPVDSDTTMRVTQIPTEIFEGSGSGNVFMVSGQNYFEALTNENFDLPGGGSPIFLEMDYRTNNTIEVGIYASDGNITIKRPVLFLVATHDESSVTQWNKVYVELTTEVSEEAVAANEFELYISIPGVDNGITNPNAYFDNIKLLYFD